MMRRVSILIWVSCAASMIGTATALTIACASGDAFSDARYAMELRERALAGDIQATNNAYRRSYMDGERKRAALNRAYDTEYGYIAIRGKDGFTGGEDGARPDDGSQRGFQQIVIGRRKDQ